MGLFWNSGDKKDRYEVEKYDSPQEFARKWQYEFAMMLDCDEDEGYDEAMAYWKSNHQ